MDNKPQTPGNVFSGPLKRGAADGKYMGLYLTLLFALWSAAIFYRFNSSIANITGMLLVIGLPVICYKLLKQSYLSGGRKCSMSALWMEGITMFACGGLIAIFVGFIFLRFIYPGFLVEMFSALSQIAGAAAQVTSGPQAEQYQGLAEGLNAVISAGEVPSAISVVLNLMWFIMASGSILSLLMSLLVKARRT